MARTSRTVLWALLVVCVVLYVHFTTWAPTTARSTHYASQRVDASMALVRSRVRATAAPPEVEEAAPHPAATTSSNPAVASSVPIKRPATATADGPTFFSGGQDVMARQSVATAIEHQPTPKEGVLWGATQSSLAQAERESDNVRRLLQADGMTRWRPDLSKLPPQRPADASMEVLLDHVAVGGTAWLAFGNAGVTEMLMNWAHHVIALGYGWHMVVAAFDEVLLLALHERRIPAYNYTGALPTTHFRHAPHLFHRMGYLKAECIRLVLLTGRHVLVSDSDVAWVGDPLPVLASLMAEGASLGASTDCLDVDSDQDKTPRSHSPQSCGYSPDNVGGAVFNTGVLWFKSDEDSISFVKAWATATLGLRDPYSDDQGAFNRLIQTGFYPVKRFSASGRVVGPVPGFGPHGLRVAPLPAEHFCSGHLVWVQQEGKTEKCLSVHATFTEYGDAGKRWRFLEAGLWAVLPREYYEEGKFLTFVPPAAGADPMPCKPGEDEYIPGQMTRPCGGEDPKHGLPPKPVGIEIMWQEGLKRSVRLRANVELMSRQVHALRDALAIARVLNRTLIIPHFECLCDRSEYPDIMPTCVYQGASPRLKMPFRCSTHFVTDTHKLQLMATEPTRFGMQPHKFNGLFTEPLKMRTHSFLHDPRTSPEIKNSIVEVHVTGRRVGSSSSSGMGSSSSSGGGGGGGGDGSLADALGAESASNTGVAGPTLSRGVTNVQLLERLAPWKDARVLQLTDAEGLFGGWSSDPNQAMLFMTMMEYYVYRGAWCCTSRFINNDADNGRVYLKPPPPLRRPG